MTSDNATPASRLVLDAVRASVADAALASDSLLAIALSGGLDSTVLLDAAVRVFGASRVIALHVHHGLSPNANAWAEQCDAFAASLAVRFAARHVDVARAGGESLEAAARDARYRALDALCREQDAHALLIAHHADDQAETVLLQLLRGAGVAGLAAMAPERREAGSVPRLRPLLRLLRAQLEQYAHERDLSWIDDESNADTRYSRNALRHDVLPVLAVHFPGFRDALARTASHAASAQRLLDDLARLDLEQAANIDEEGALRLDALLALDDERALNLMRFWIRARGVQAASTARIADMLRQLRDIADGPSGHALRVDHAGHSLRVYRNALFWEPGDSGDAPDLDGSATQKPPGELYWTGEEVWRLPQWRGSFVFEPVDTPADDVVGEGVLRAAPLVARSRAGGERMRAAGIAPGRTLKNLFQERGVPAWKRDVPLLYAGDALLFVPHIGVNRETAPDATHGPLRRITWRPDLLLA